MAKGPYLPPEEEKLREWFEKFNKKLPAHAATFGLTPGQLASVNADTLNFSYWLGQSDLFKDEKEERVDYKNLLKDGPLGAPAGTPPTPPVIAAPPPAVLPGIVPRTRQLVRYLKNHLSYSETIGQDLDIIGAEDTTEKATLKPIIKLVLTGAGVNVKWTKGIAQAIRIEKDSGSGYQLLAIDTEPDYLDTTPITGAATRKYRAIYIIKDEMAGLWSDVASIAVG